MEKSKWDFQSLADYKRAIRFEIQCDIDKLDHAVGLLKEVNETLIQAFLNHLDNSENPPSTHSTAGTAPMKMSRAISDIQNIQHAMKIAKEQF